MPVTLKDIAERANVTQQAVSLALRGHTNVSLPTRRKVRQIARELGYRPNLHARNLRSRGTKAVGFVFPDITYGYAQSIIEGARSVLEKLDYLTIIGLTSWDAAREAREIELLLGYQVQALICQPVVNNSHEVYEKVVQAGTPVIFVANGLDVPGTGWVGCDGYDGGSKIMRHLLGLGHRRIAFVCTDSTEQSLALGPIRQAYLDALKHAGLPVGERLLRYAKLNHPDSVREIADGLLSADEPPTAIFAISDSIAYTVMDRLMQRGVRVPQDISVAGIGGAAPSSMEMISLTTVDDDAGRMGSTAAQCVLELLRDPEISPTRTCIKYPAVTHRRSTDRPRSGGLSR